jgi:hypothetical protein
MTRRRARQVSTILLPVLIVLLAAACGGGSSMPDALDGLAGRLPDAVRVWRAAGNATLYDTESIYGYIDGHAELYLAYGLSRCLAVRYLGPGEAGDIVLDVFELASSADAYGVFTQDRDGEPVEIGRDGLLRPGWLSFWQGRYFVSVYSEGEAAAARGALLDLARAAAAALPAGGERPALVDQLPTLGLQASSVRFLRSPQILNAVVFVGEDNPLRLGPGVSATIARYHRDEAGGYLVLVDYEDAASRAVAERSFRSELLDDAPAGEAVEGSDGLYYAASGNGARLVAVLASGSRELARSLLEEGLAPGGGA